MLSAALALALAASSADAAPIAGDLIPVELRGTWAGSLSACRDPDTTLLRVGADTVHFYEDVGHLLIGAASEHNLRQGAPPDIGFLGRFIFMTHDRISESDIELRRDGPGLLLGMTEEPIAWDEARPDPAERRVRCPGR